MNYKAKVKGSLLAGALGDALGYGVEFYTYDYIKKLFGPKGIQKPLLQKDGKAWISDDTQMTLFTWEGLLYQKEDPIVGIFEAYLDWFNTQRWDYEVVIKGKVKEDRLCFEKGLYENRAPGNTCLSALEDKKMGSLEVSVNHSKGCGGVMRIAPVAYYYANKDKTIEEIALLGTKASALTHSHILSHISAYFLTCLYVEILRENSRDLKAMVLNCLDKTNAFFCDCTSISYFEKLIQKVLVCADNDEKDVDNIHILGEGWVAEEAVAIALYAFLKYPYDSKEALIASVNHNGDSDSTGSICGNLIGAYLGEEALPKEWLDVLELKEVMEKLIEKAV